MKKYYGIFLILTMQILICIYTVVNTDHLFYPALIVAGSIVVVIQAAKDFLNIRRKEIERFDKMYIPYLTIIFFFLMVFQLMFLLLSEEILLKSNFIILFLGIYSILLGNLTPKLPFKSSMGLIFAPWTFKTENVWKKSNRLAGILTIIFGVILVVVSFLDFNRFVYIGIILSLLIIGMVYLAFYSWRLHKKSL